MKKIIGSLVFLVLVVVGVCLFYKHSGFFLYDQNPLQYMPNMHHTRALIPERGYDFYKNGSAARTPPAGTLSRNQKVYPYKKEDDAGKVEKFSNPLPATREVVMRGQKIYMQYCVVCHGPSAQGNGYVVPPFSQPPSLNSDKIRGYADSQIFHVITVGQNLMGAYGPQIRENDRWAAIHYLRVIQRSENPTPEDIAAFDRMLNKTGEGSK